VYWHFVVKQKQMRYHHPMRPAPPKLMAILCFCLLAMQVSGLHLHAGLEGNGDLHTTHVHAADPDGNGHETDSDVSFFEASSRWMKPIPFLFLFIAAVFALVTYGKQAWVPVTKPFHPCSHFRWRPPLRAPPYLLS
jgi:hypothetical protein